MKTEHFEFIKEFSRTQTFKNFQSMLKKQNTNVERKTIHIIDNFKVKVDKMFSLGSKSSRKMEEAKEDLREVFDVDKLIPHFTFNNMQEKYFKNSEFIPIKQIITSGKGETASYRYTYFPKMLDVISTDREVYKTINWPQESLTITKPWGTRDIFNPENSYTHENITDALWLT